jgi:hypothetical protein
MDLEVFYLICGYEMVLDLRFLEIGDSELLCLGCVVSVEGGSVVGSVASVGVWVCWWCFQRGCVGLLLVVFPAWVCGSVVGGVSSMGVGLLVVFPAWVCGFVGGTAGVGVWVCWWCCRRGCVDFLVNWSVEKNIYKKKGIILLYFNRMYCKIKNEM